MWFLVLEWPLEPSAEVIAVRLGTVAVTGRSMLPLLQEGDFLVVRWDGRVRAGDVVVGGLHGRPGLRVVKRAVRPVDGPAGSCLLVSDNATAPGAVQGPGEVEAVVLARYWPPRRIGRVPRGPRRLRER